ncbi:MAG: PhzF family phenazine biosynthesis protein [Holosporales bacterium]|jgi:predicted PhzF superfamily epimerase YddE/YHI9|nr:PhzF family phenazine biosynthesis protein [Holosporales bacterium]
MATNFWIVDTLSPELLHGNPSAVFLVDTFKDQDLLQNVAMEINTPETIFAQKLSDDHFTCQCFSPKSHDVDFGNGIFALAKVVAHQDPSLKEFKATLSQKTIIVRLLDDGSIQLQYDKVTIRKTVMPANLHSALNGELVVSVAECDGDLIVEIRSPKKLLNLNPSIDILGNIVRYNSFIITTDTHYEFDMPYDFCVKVLAPKLGIFRGIMTPISCVKLASYWAQRMGKTTFIASQSSRDKECKANIISDGAHVLLTSNCVIVAEGEILAF